MAVISTETMPVVSEADIVTVRRCVRESASKIGFTLVDQTKVVTAASELARNTLIHGHGGRMELATLNGPRVGLRLTFEDTGPGIPDIDLALRDGFTTGSGLGLGLGGAKRLVNEFEVKSRVGEGTKVTVIRWK
ncbi:MAG TPA: anti-sigma regulatory factor [Candidatus Acidoferrales bacterium]|jgi:serine/threonine-protein kinase RsbT|nr:anti-sigma regulatory factor [Candidatus Acidoferrales bacterium]